MSSNLIGELVANNGTYFLDSDEYRGNIDQIIVRGNGIVAFWIFTSDNEGDYVDVSFQYSIHGSDTKIPTGTRITPKNDDVFTKVRINFANEDCGLELVLA